MDYFFQGLEDHIYQWFRMSYLKLNFKLNFNFDPIGGRGRKGRLVRKRKWSLKT